jgi:hypothetical protein
MHCGVRGVLCTGQGQLLERIWQIALVSQLGEMGPRLVAGIRLMCNIRLWHVNLEIAWVFEAHVGNDGVLVRDECSAAIGSKPHGMNHHDGRQAPMYV